MADKRIIEQNASTTVPDDAFFIFDSALLGTFKISQSALLDFFGNATITEVTKAQYDALPDTKLTDGVLYAIKDQETSYVVDIEVDGSSILDEDGIADLSVISKIEEEIANAIAEEYDSTHTYYNTGLVFHEGVLYQCTATSTTGTWDSTKWNVVDIKDLLDNVSINIGYLWNIISNTIAGNYDTSSTYNTGDYAIYSLKLYRCKDDGVTGAWNSSKWEEVNIPEYIDYVLENAGKVDDVKVDGTSVVTNKVAEIEIPVKDVQVKTDSTYDSVVDDSGNAKIDLSGKANTSGYYEDFIAGTAENLMADNYTEDKVPYNFRQSFNGARLEDEIVGGTVAWNQQLSLSNLPSDSALYSNTTYTVNGVTFTKNNDGSITIQTESGGATSETSVKIGNDARLEFIKSHIHYIPRCKGGSASTYYFNYAGSRYVYDNDKIFAKQPSGFNMWLTVKQGTVITTPVKVYPQVVDLEQMFGSTIADYIYSLEQATAGAGIAYFRNLFPKSYYAYNAGTLMSVNTSSHNTIGFNQWDEEWEIISNALYSKNYIPVKPNTQYYITPHQGRDYICLDSQYNVVKDWTWLSSMYSTFTTPSNCYYVKFRMTSAYGTTYNNDICINISDASKNGTYEPYTKHTYPLDSDLTLRGIPKLDSNNNLYYDGDIYESDGSVTRRYGVVDLGTLSWGMGSVSGGNRRFLATISDIKTTGDATKVGNIICTKYVSESNSTQYSGVAGICVHQSDHEINIYDKNYLSASTTEFKSAMSGIYLVYELATPTSETADAFATPQIVNPKGTEEYVDYAESQGTRDVAIPVGHNSKYYADLKTKIEDIPDVPSTNGTYTLKATRSASGVTYSWVSG